MNYKKHIQLVLTVLIVFLLIKCINNYSFIFSIIKDFIETIMPFIIGVILAYALNPMVTFLEKKYKLSRGISISIIFLLVGTIITIFMLFIIPVLINNIAELFSQIPMYLQQIENFIMINMNKIDKLTNTNTVSFIISKIETLAPNILEIGKNLLGQILTTTISLTNIIINIVLSIVICIYTLIDKERFISYLNRLNKLILKDKAYITIDFLKTCNDIIGKYIIAYSIDSFFVGLISTIFLLSIDAHYAVLFGVLIGFTNMIPIFGPFIGGIPTVLFNLFYSYKLAIIITIFIIVLQQIDGNIIAPKIISNRVGINRFLMIFSVTLGGHYFGILGMVLSIPFMGVFKIYLDKFIQNKENKYIKIEE